MATYSKTPVRRSTETITIIPSSRKMTFHSMPVSSLKNAFSASVMCSSSISPAPPSATLVRWTLSVASRHVGADEDDDREVGVHGVLLSPGSVDCDADQTSRHTGAHPTAPGGRTYG